MFGIADQNQKKENFEWSTRRDTSLVGIYRPSRTADDTICAGSMQDRRLRGYFFSVL